MPSLNHYFFIFFLTLFFPVKEADAQGLELVFKEVIHGYSGNSTRPPEKINIFKDKGTILFSVQSNTTCKEYFEFNYNFPQQIDQFILTGKDSISFPVKAGIIALGPSCYSYNNESFRNPFTNITGSGQITFSGLISQLKSKEEWPYKNVSSIFSSRFPYSYAYNYPSGSKTGIQNGEIILSNLDKLKPGDPAFFQLKISATSPMGGPENNFYYEILMVYEVQKINNLDPCKIEIPDCSCCPGTIPIWNFKTNSGDCICPEGSKWDKMKGKCVVIED
ncbi:MAG: hypothetical protein R2879_00320 [Saprospiraceae bacterium]